MRDDRPIGAEACSRALETDPAGIEARLKEELKKLGRKIVVLDDDPTGIQTVHDVYVYTDWKQETLEEAFQDQNSMFFILTNSRGMTSVETERVHQEIARNLLSAARRTRKDFLLVSRSDSTLRGHYPLETQTLREELEASGGKRYDGEIIYPFFKEGGRFTLNGVHYVKEGASLTPAGMTEFARDKSFAYHSSYLPNWCQEKSGGAIRAEDVLRIPLEALQGAEIDRVTQLLLSCRDFRRVVVDSVDDLDVSVFSAALCRAIARGKEFLIRSAAAVPRALSGNPPRPLLSRPDLIDENCKAGGMVLIGSHVQKTTAQLEGLKASSALLEWIEFNQHLALEPGGLSREAERSAFLAEKAIRAGKTAVVYTRRERLDLDTEDPDRQLLITTEISDAVTSVVGRLTVKPRFLIAKGGITSSDVGVKALKVKRALALGQVKPGIPVWLTGAESKFPSMPYLIFPGNVGTVEELREIVELLSGDGGKEPYES